MYPKNLFILYPTSIEILLYTIVKFLFLRVHLPKIKFLSPL